MTALIGAPRRAARMPEPPAPLKSTLPLTSAAMAVVPGMTMTSFSSPSSRKNPLTSATGRLR
jgi:hypothetical protein